MTGGGSTGMPPFWKATLFLMANLVVAVIAPAILSQTKIITTSESILLGGIILILLVALEAFYQFTSIEATRRGEVQNWIIDDEIDRRLANIRTCFHSLSSRDQVAAN